MPSENEQTIISLNSILQQFNKSNNRKELIYAFCENIDKWTIVSNDLTSIINAKKSLFLRAFCYTTDPQFEQKFMEYDDIDIIKTKLQMEQFRKACDSWLRWGDKDSWNNISFVCVARQIYTALMNDYINMIYYKAYGWFADTVEKFVEIYFYDWDYNENWQPKNNWTCEVGKYIQWTIPEDRKYCWHIETYKELVKTGKSLDKILQKTSIIKWYNFIQSNLWKEKWMPHNFEWYANIIDTIYNEMYFYNLFLLIRSYYLPSNKLFAPTVISNQTDLITKNIDKEVMYASKEIVYSQKAMRISLRMLKNLERAYPLHIWIIAITEDFIFLRKYLAKIYTPIHQLNYKLINAHELSEP